MKVIVDTALCADHGQCVISSPDIFRFDEDGKLVWEPEPGADRRAAAEEAADVCPVQAILVTHER